MFSVRTDPSEDAGSDAPPSTDSRKDSQASTKAQRARLFITIKPRWTTDDVFGKSSDTPSDLYTAISSETLGTIVIPELQGNEHLPVFWWDPFRSEDGDFLVAWNRFLKVEHTDDDLRKYTMIVAVSKPIGRCDKEWVQEKYRSFGDIVFDEGMQQAVTAAGLNAECKPPYDRSFRHPEGRARGYVIEETEQSERPFVCWVME
jgi:hypothetical protein